MLAELQMKSAERDAAERAAQQKIRRQIVDAELSGKGADADAEALLSQAVLLGVTSADLEALQFQVEQFKLLQDELGPDADFQREQTRLSKENDESAAARKQAEIVLAEALGRERGSLRMMQERRKSRTALQQQAAEVRRSIDAWIGGDITTVESEAGDDE